MSVTDKALMAFPLQCGNYDDDLDLTPAPD
jgi:hypothetical protein